MFAQQGSLGQPLLIPLSMAGSVGGQGGLAVLTLPTATVATIPGLTAVSPAGGLLKLPFAGLQGMVLLTQILGTHQVQSLLEKVHILHSVGMRFSLKCMKLCFYEMVFLSRPVNSSE